MVQRIMEAIWPAQSSRVAEHALKLLRVQVKDSLLHASGTQAGVAVKYNEWMEGVVSLPSCLHARQTQQCPWPRPASPVCIRLVAPGSMHISSCLL